MTDVVEAKSAAALADEPRAASSGAEASLALVRGLVAAIPAKLGALVARAPELGFLDGLAAGARVVVAGIGASEGPARYLESVLASLGVDARFAPLSELACGARSARAHGAASLVLFSQGLSPNARLALRRAAAFDRAVLVTSLDEARATGDGYACLTAFKAHGGRVVTLDASDESAMLARFQGPAVACFAAAIAASRLEGAAFGDALAQVPEAITHAGVRAVAELAQLAPGALDRVEFVTSRVVGAPYQGLRWTCLEALGRPEPHAWDVLHVAHGAYQELYDKRVTLLALEAADGADAPLFDRLARMLEPERHTLVRLRATLPPELALFEYAAFVDQLVVRLLHASPRDLTTWPGKGLDAPLYELDGAPERET